MTIENENINRKCDRISLDCFRRELFYFSKSVLVVSKSICVEMNLGFAFLHKEVLQFSVAPSSALVMAISDQKITKQNQFYTGHPLALLL